MTDDIVDELDRTKSDTADRVEHAIQVAYDLGVEAERTERAEWFKHHVRLTFMSYPELGLVVELQDGIVEDHDDTRVFLGVEAAMRKEIKNDPHFAVQMAAEFRRIAALTDGLVLPDLD